MPGGGITGDGSVKWFIDMYDAEKGLTRVDPREGSKGRGLHVEGLDNVNGPNFVITLKHPPKDSQERKDFIDQLEKQWRRAKDEGATQTILTIPIEHKDRRAEHQLADYQITVTWDRPGTRDGN